jgi:hypothetical protein
MSTTLNIYTHAVDASHRKAIEAVERELLVVLDHSGLQTAAGLETAEPVGYWRRRGRSRSRAPARQRRRRRRDRYRSNRDDVWRRLPGGVQQRTFRFAEIVAAHQFMEANKATGKLVVLVDG